MTMHPTRMAFAGWWYTTFNPKFIAISRRRDTMQCWTWRKMWCNCPWKYVRSIDSRKIVSLISLIFSYTTKTASLAMIIKSSNDVYCFPFCYYRDIRDYFFPSLSVLRNDHCAINFQPGDIKLKYNKTLTKRHKVKCYGILLFINIDNKYAIKHRMHVVYHSAKSQKGLRRCCSCVLLQRMIIYVTIK